jgi:hypothetical protein
MNSTCIVYWTGSPEKPVHCAYTQLKCHFVPVRCQHTSSLQEIWPHKCAVQVLEVLKEASLTFCGWCLNAGILLRCIGKVVFCVHVLHLGSHWMVLHEVWCWWLITSVRELQVWLKLDKNVEHCTWPPKYISCCWNQMVCVFGCYDCHRVINNVECFIE